ncbi:MAG: DUF4321 domain-containing protein [bacterium]
MRKKSLGFIVLVIVLGAMIGTLIGKLLGLVLPDGVVKEFFLNEAFFEIGPAVLNAGLFAITIGFKIVLNIVGLIGIAVAIYLFRWY